MARLAVMKAWVDNFTAPGNLSAALPIAGPPMRTGWRS